MPLHQFQTFCVTEKTGKARRKMIAIVWGEGYRKENGRCNPMVRICLPASRAQYADLGYYANAKERRMYAGQMTVCHRLWEPLHYLPPKYFSSSSISRSAIASNALSSTSGSSSVGGGRELGAIEDQFTPLLIRISKLTRFLPMDHLLIGQIEVE